MTSLKLINSCNKYNQNPINLLYVFFLYGKCETCKINLTLLFTEAVNVKNEANHV